MFCLDEFTYAPQYLILPPFVQITLLEGRDKCEFKITKPLKFMTGRADCIPEDLETPYVSTKEEV